MKQKRIRILGGGWYGCHLALSLLADGIDVELHELQDDLFAGASGSNPARLHDGFHYPRSALTRQACQMHRIYFMGMYGKLTRAVPLNLYAIAAHDSLVDFETYRQVLQDRVPFLPVETPGELGLLNVEGALSTGERHIVIREAREHFRAALGNRVRFNTPRSAVDSPQWDMTIDCTFCSNDSQNVERYEPCITVLLEGPTDRAVTIMDGPFPSIYPWDEERKLCSLTSAKLTPLGRFATRAEAQSLINQLDSETITRRAIEMQQQMGFFYPASLDLYKRVDALLSIRAMPRSGAAARLVDVVRVGSRALRVRAGKIDAVFEGDAQIRRLLNEQWTGTR